MSCCRGPERPVRVQAHSASAQACTHKRAEARRHTRTAHTCNRALQTRHTRRCTHVHTRRCTRAGLQTTRTLLTHSSHGPGTCQCEVLRLEGACLSRWWCHHRELAFHAATGAAVSQGAQVPPGAGKATWTPPEAARRLPSHTLNAPSKAGGGHAGDSLASARGMSSAVPPRPAQPGPAWSPHLGGTVSPPLGALFQDLS